MTDTGNDMSPEAALAALEWLAAMGADEAMGDAPVDRFAESARPPAPVPGKPPLMRETKPANPESPVMADRTADAEAAIADARQVAAACGSIAEIEAALSRFEACPLSRTATRLVFADGAVAGRILVVGDQPGREDDTLGKPFAGPEGSLLDRMLAAIGHSRETVLLTNAVFWRPPGERKPTEAELLMCLPFLERLIALMQPSAIFCLGELAAHKLTGATDGIRKLRGKWLEHQGVPIMASWHPRMLMTTPAMKADAWKDLQALKVKLDAATRS